MKKTLKHVLIVVICIAITLCIAAACLAVFSGAERHNEFHAILVQRFLAFMHQYSILAHEIMLLIIFLLGLSIVLHAKSVKTKDELTELTDHVPGGLAIYEYDGEFKPIYISEQTCKMFGFTKEEYKERIRKNVAVNFMPDIGELSQKIDINNLPDSGSSDNILPFPAQRKDGSWFWLKTEVNWKRIKNGNIRIYAILNDVSMQQNRNEQLDALSFCLPGGIIKVAINEKKEIIHISSRLCEILGYTKEELLKKTEGQFAKLLYDVDVIPFFNSVQKQISDSGRFEAVEIRAVCKDGSLKWLMAVGKLVNDADGNRSIYALMLDDDERQHLLLKMTDNENRLNNIVYNAPCGLIEFSLHGDTITCDFVSPQAAKHHADSSENVQKWFNIDVCHYTHPDDKAKLRAEVEYAKIHGTGLSIEYRIIINGGDIVWLHLISNPYRLADGTIKYICAYTDITEIHIITDALLEQQERIQFLMNFSEMSVWKYYISDDKSRWEFNAPWNNCNCSGDFKSDYVVENVSKCGRDFFGVCDDSIEEYENMYRRIAAGEPLIDVNIHSKINGKDSWNRIVYRTIFLDGKPIGASGYSRNITDIIKNEQIYQNEIKYLEDVHSENLLEKARISISDDIIYSYSSYFGYDMCEVGMPFTQGIQKLSEQIVISNQSVEVKNTYSVESIRAEFNNGKTEITTDYLRQLAEDRPPIWCRLSLKMFVKPGTDELCGFIYSYDINEETIKGHIVNRLFHADYNAVGLLDLIGDRLRPLRKTDDNFFTATADTEYGMIFSESVDRMIERVFSQSEKDEALVAFKSDTIIKELENKEKYSVSFFVTLDDGLHRMRWDFLSLSETKTAVIYVRTDVTELYNSGVKQREVLDNALRDAEKANRAKTDFLNTMSHDIRTPMNAIMNLTNMIRDDYNEACHDSVLADLDKLDSASKFLKGLINDILDVSRIESGKMKLNPEVYEYDEFRSYIFAIFGPLCKEKNIAFTWDEGPTSVNIFVDKVRFNQIFSNLISNAIKYTPEGGCVTYRTYDNVIKDNVLTCKFDIIDTGYGMSEEFQKKMFLPFERESRVISTTEGTGLGLSIVKSLVDMMGGTILVESRINEGTTVTLELAIPIATEEQTRQFLAKKNAVKDQTSFERCKVLVAEDNKMNVMIVKRLLAKDNIEIVEAKNGKEALEIFEASAQGCFKMILMDMRMPVMDGVESAKCIRALNRDDAKKIPIIAVTADVFSNEGKERLKNEFNDWLFKPIDPDKFHSILVQYLK